MMQQNCFLRVATGNTNGDVGGAPESGFREREGLGADTTLSLGGGGELTLACPWECSRGTLLRLPKRVTKEPPGMAEVKAHNSTVWQPRETNGFLLYPHRERKRAGLVTDIDALLYVPSITKSSI